MTNRNVRMKFRLVRRSMTMKCYKFEFCWNFADFGGNDSWMKIDPHYQQQIVVK